MSYEAVGRRYGRAIFELAREAKSEAAIARDFQSFAKTYEQSADLQRALGDPLVPEGARENILSDVVAKLELSPLAQSAVRFIARKRRMGAISAIASELARLVDEASGLVRAKVSSAAPLDAAYLDKLRAEIERATGRKVQLTHTVDPSLIAGIVTRIGDRVIDGSLRARLDSFRDLPRT